jgi:hypothetical protein
MGEPASSDLIDFFEERNRLYQEIDKSNGRYKIEKKMRRATTLEKHPRSLFDRLEGLLYSLLSAAALVSILWALAGLADFSSSPAQRTGSNQSGTVLPTISGTSAASTTFRASSPRGPASRIQRGSGAD